MSVDRPSGNFPSESPPTGRRPASDATRRLRAWQVAGLLLFLAVVGLGLYGLWPIITGQSGEEAARDDVEAPSSKAQIKAIVARRVDFPLRTQASGHLVPWHAATLRTEAGGQIRERAVREGERVDDGDLLAELENREEQIALKEARAQLLEARAEYRAKYTGTKGPSGSESSTDTTSSPVSDRRATQAAVSGLTAARQAVERAKLNLEHTRVTAPFAGRVANLDVEEGQYVSSGAEVATLLRDDRMKVEVDVLERDAVHVDEGATARVHVPAVGPEADSTAWVEGAVWAVNPQVDVQSGTGRVTVAVPNPEGRLVAGLYAEARLETERLQDRLVVPDEAVLVRQGRDLVFVVRDGRAQWSYVELGARSGDYVEITDGVAPGDTVAVDGHFALAHDAPVRVEEVRPHSLK